MRTVQTRRESLDGLKTIIQQRSGGPIRVGRKGLRFGTSRLECYLSHTDAAWPGDADLVVYDAGSSCQPTAIIELKKHTRHSTLPFLEQRLENYYPKPDGRKYDRLIALANHLSDRNVVPIFVLYYSTAPSVDYVILEKVDRGARAPRGVRISTVPFTDNAGSFASKLFEAMESAG